MAPARGVLARASCFGLRQVHEAVREFRCRLTELGPLDAMVQAMFTTNKADFGKASADYLDPDYLKGWNDARKTFTDLVPTGVRKATNKKVTKAMTKLAKSLRDPLNILTIRLNRAEKAKSLSTSAADFGLGKVRSEITTRDMEGLDGALNHLLQLVQLPANLAALTAKGHTAADTKAFKDARQQITDFNTAQNTNQDAALELTEANISAGNALWEYIADTLTTGNLMYKETEPKKAKTFTLTSLMKRIRNESGGAAAETPAPEV